MPIYSTVAIEVLVFNTLVDEKALEAYLKRVTPSQGSIVYSEKTKAYAGQMQYLATVLFSGEHRRWVARQLNNTDPVVSVEDKNAIYRGFYLSECVKTPVLKSC